MTCLDSIRYSLANRSLVVDLLSILLGLNSLIATNGLWVEVPLMVGVLPEKWQLTAYISVIIQAANLGPIVYAFASWKWPGRTTETIAIYVMLFIGTSAAAILSFTWSITMLVGSKLHSVPLLICTFLLALVDSTSSVVCLPFMARLNPCYVTSYMIGEALSGFLPSIAALIQGVDDYTQCRNVSVTDTVSNETIWILEPVPPKPRFSPDVFFACLATIMAVSSFGFGLLHISPIAKRERVAKPSTHASTINGMELYSVPTDEDTKIVGDKRRWWGFTRSTILLLGVQAWISVIGYGVLPAVQSYSCLPYGSEAFHLAVILTSASTPLSCLVALAFPTKMSSIVVLLTVAGTAVSSYCLTLAVLSPTPPLVGTDLGGFIMVSSWTVFTGLFGYCKLMVAAILVVAGHRALFWCGALTQAGSSFGAMLLFVLVTVVEVLHEQQDC